MNGNKHCWDRDQLARIGGVLAVLFWTAAIPVRAEASGAFASAGTALADTVEISISETVSVSDAAEVSPPASVSVDETVTVNDAPAVRPPASVSVTETVTVSDAPQVTPPASIAVTETVNVVDTAAVSPPASIAVTETVAVSDAPQVTPPASIAVTETVSVTDAPHVIPPTSIMVTESVSVSDSAGGTPSPSLSVDESVTVTDAVQVSLSPIISVTETIHVSDQVELDVAVLRVIALLDGWNLLSIPLETSDQSFGALLSPCTSGFFFQTGSSYQPIASGDVLPPGEGFWANCASGTVEISGQPVGSQTTSVDGGWNLIGPFADPVQATSVTSDPPGLRQSPFYRYDAVSGYRVADSLRPGHGYWVQMGAAGTLDLSGTGANQTAVAAPADARRPVVPSETATGVRLTLTDADGRSRSLYFAPRASPDKRQQYALPPRPPSDVFDVRFANGGRRATSGTAADEGPAMHTIETQGVQGPVTLRLEGASEETVLHVEHSAGGETETVRLTATSPTVELASAKRLKAAVRTAPGAFALAKSVPNPVRQRATIAYAVPRASDVTIAVYDVLGRRIATLVDAHTQPGRHRAQLDARHLPSGTYFVRMRAGDFTQTRRLTVVR